MGQAAKILTLDLEPIKAQVGIHRLDVEELTEKAIAVEIDTDKDEQAVVALDVCLNQLKKELEKERKDIVETPWNYCKEVNAYVKVMTDALDKARTLIKGKLKQYIAKKRLAEAKQQDLINKANEKLQKQIAEQTPEGMVVPQVAPIQVPQKQITRTADRSASAYTKKIWKAEITNAALVPREYCVPNLQLIVQAAKMGVRFIPGARIWEEEDIVTRQN